MVDVESMKPGAESNSSSNVKISQLSDHARLFFKLISDFVPNDTLDTLKNEYTPLSFAQKQKEYQIVTELSQYYQKAEEYKKKDSANVEMQIENTRGTGMQMTDANDSDLKKQAKLS